MKRYISTGLSLPTAWMQKIDSERGDISRSRYLLRLLERAHNLEEKHVKKIQRPGLRGVCRSQTKVILGKTEKEYGSGNSSDGYQKLNSEGADLIE
jgi:hypothetical protein